MTHSPLTWRLLTLDEQARLYEEQMRRDFPKEELKDCQTILDTSAQGAGHVWGVFDGDALAAYLLMVRPAGCAISQLDYFAVLPAQRAAGLGGRLLAVLPQYEGDAQAIVIEAECPARAPDPAMARRRLGFYARYGAQDTGWTEHLFDAWFRILVLPCPGCAPIGQEEAVRQLAQCYRRSLSEEKWRTSVQFFRPDGEEVAFQ